jgi:hypothetical protein
MRKAQAVALGRVAALERVEARLAVVMARAAARPATA